MKLIAASSFCLCVLIPHFSCAAEQQGFERMVVQRSDGTGGIRETYEITADGKYNFSDLAKMNKGQLEGEQLKAFLTAVNSVEWAKLPPKKNAAGAARFKPELFQYSVAIVTEKKLYQVSFHESAYADDKQMQAFLGELLNCKQLVK